MLDTDYILEPVMEPAPGPLREVPERIGEPRGHGHDERESNDADYRFVLHGGLVEPVKDGLAAHSCLRCLPCQFIQPRDYRIDRVGHVGREEIPRPVEPHLLASELELKALRQVRY